MSYEIQVLKRNLQVLKRNLENTDGFDNAVSRIVTQFETNEAGETVIHIRVGLSPSFEIKRPSVAIGRKLNAIASIINTRSADLPVSPAISFFQESGS